MLTALMVAMVVTCKPYHPTPPPQVTVTTVRCEGSDQVRRNVFGGEVGRVRMACRPPAPPVRLTTQPGWKFGLKAT